MTLEPTTNRHGLDLLTAAAEQWPEHRRELLGGSLVVSAPRGRWQHLALERLDALLHRTAPRDFTVDVDVELPLAPDTVVRPDLVVRRQEESARGLPALLVVEILDRSSARMVQGVKRDLYAAAGIPTVWIADPLAPSLRVLTLANAGEGSGALLETARAEGDEVLSLGEPFPVQVRPSGLGID